MCNCVFLDPTGSLAFTLLVSNQLSNCNWILKYLNTWILKYLNTWILLYFHVGSSILLEFFSKIPLQEMKQYFIWVWKAWNMVMWWWMLYLENFPMLEYYLLRYWRLESAAHNADFLYCILLLISIKKYFVF